MRAFAIGDHVEIKTDDHATGRVSHTFGVIDDLDAIGVTIRTSYGTLDLFPWTVVRRMTKDAPSEPLSKIV
jgi:hypothetical protein